MKIKDPVNSTSPISSPSGANTTTSSEGQDKLVEIALFDSLQEGQMALLMLREEAIECELVHEALNSVYGSLPGISNVAILVRLQDYEKALSLLEEGEYIPREVSGKDVSEWYTRTRFLGERSLAVKLFVIILFIITLMLLLYFYVSASEYFTS